MKCNMKTMLATGIGLLVILAIAYDALPQFRTFVLNLGSSWLFLLLLLCPLSMFFMMKGMNSNKDDQRSATSDTSRDRQPQSGIDK
jgi:Protein of unknown function (DUF2933)